MAELELRPDKRRMAMVTDVFIVVVMVVMAADLRNVLPGHPADIGTWAPVAPRLLAFVLGFFTLAVLWVNHNLLTGALEDATRGALWLNLILLFWVSLFPVTVRLLGGGASLQTGALAYGVVLAAMSVSIASLRAFVRAKSRANPSMAFLSEISTYRSIAASLICAGSIPVAFLNPWVSIACFVAAPALFLFPEPKQPRPEA